MKITRYKPLPAFVAVLSAFAPLSLYSQYLPADQSIGQERTPVALVNGKAVSAAELSDATAAQLRQLFLQEYQIKRDALENLINQKVMEAEAHRKGIPVEKLLEQEVDGKIGDPSDLEVQAYYLGQKDRINKPLAEVELQLRGSLRQNRLQQARLDYVNSLRTAAGVTVLLRPPKSEITADPARVRGVPTAAVTIIEFSDFQCPYCQAVEPTLKQVLSQYGDRVSFAYRDFPLTPIHPQAQIAAEASRCAGEQEKYWDYHDALFANQSLLQQADLVRSAARLGLDEKKFETCLTSRKFQSAVQADYQAGLKGGVTGTPAFFINGTLLSGNQPLAEFARVIDDELNALQSQSQAAKSTARKEETNSKRR